MRYAVRLDHLLFAASLVLIALVTLFGHAERQQDDAARAVMAAAADPSTR